MLQPGGHLVFRDELKESRKPLSGCSGLSLPIEGKVMLINHYSDMSGAGVVEIEGCLTQTEATEARRLLTRIAHDDHGRLVIDFSGVRFIDAVGLSVFLTLRKAVIEEQGRLVFACVSNEVQAFMELTRLHLIFEFFKSKDAAIEALSKV
jgi:anti-sigma B factor antagonist